MPNLKVVVQYDDVKLNSIAKIQTTILNVDNIISATTNPPTLISGDIGNKLTAGSDNIISATTDPSALISGDIGNELTVGSDNKLLLETDKLQTSFNYASSVSTFWSI